MSNIVPVSSEAKRFGLMLVCLLTDKDCIFIDTTVRSFISKSEFVIEKAACWVII